jgi:DNA-binding response OmpR family regulator
VRTPGHFRHPNVPMIMLTGHSERWRVEEAMRLGVNEYLLKPVSGKLLCDRLIATLNKPRPIVKVGRYYGPEPRPGSVYKPVNEASMDEIAIIKPVNETPKPKPANEVLPDDVIFIN